MDTVLSTLFVAAILLLSAFLTQLFAQSMYKRCGECDTLNARRRTRCRRCGEDLWTKEEEAN